MSKFNTPKTQPKTKTTNRAGGDAYKQSNKLALVSMMLTSFLKDQYYRTKEDSLSDLITLVKNNDPKFAAKTAIFARDKFGVRSVSHVVVGEVVNAVKGESWVKHFIERVIVRPDDALEIMSYHLSRYGKPIPNSLKKGIAARLSTFNAHLLSKYKKSQSELKMVDLVNLVHPKSTPALKSLVDGTLGASETWETKLTQVGQAAETEDELSTMKQEAWEDMILNNKLPYFALLRNLRNILQSTDNEDVISKAVEMLTNEEAVKKSRVFPFRFYTAYDEIQKISGKNARAVLKGISKALDISCSNIPVLPGKTVIFIDESGSMGCCGGSLNSMQGSWSAIKIAAVFGIAIAKAQDADIVMFSGDAHSFNYDPDSSTLSLVDKMVKGAQMGSTNFIAPFNFIRKSKVKYDRIIILSDMQGWDHRSYYNSGDSDRTVQEARAAYAKAVGVTPFLYSWDLQGYGDMQFPESTVACVAGFSEKMLNMFEIIESDKNALVKEIDAIEL